MGATDQPTEAQLAGRQWISSQRLAESLGDMSVLPLNQRRADTHEAQTFLSGTSLELRDTMQTSFSVRLTMTLKWLAISQNSAEALPDTWPHSRQ